MERDDLEHSGLGPTGVYRRMVFLRTAAKPLAAPSVSYRFAPVLLSVWRSRWVGGGPFFSLDKATASRNPLDSQGPAP
jgi:hypothetical protein